MIVAWDMKFLFFFENHIVRPIKWKGISSGLIFCHQKMSQNNLKNFLCKIKLKIANFSFFFPNSALENTLHLMIFIWCTHNLLKTAKKPKVMWFSSHTEPQTAVRLYIKVKTAITSKRNNLLTWFFFQGS